MTTQLSGGLDSSSVTAQAAILLQKEHKNLTAFTSIPNQLEGPSYRPGWFYHELPRIKKILQKYPNINHILYTANPNTNIFEKLNPIQKCFDQPLRNINNLDWSMASYEQVLSQNGRILLIGAAGNGSISWTGYTFINSLKDIYAAVRTKKFWKNYSLIRHPHEIMLSGHSNVALRASVYPMQLWYGVRRLDPTQDLDLSIFCYNVPQWVYCRGQKPLQKRLLTREGLSSILPEAISKNPYRGEQGADWYLHYNIHAQKWLEHIQNLPEPANSILWRYYDRSKIMTLFDTYPHLGKPPTRQQTHDLSLYLLRCLSVGFFLTSNLHQR